MMTDRSGFPAISPFSIYLRTGLRIAAPERQNIEAKFNPWHDPEDGRFTFAGRGTYFERGSRSGSSMRMTKPPTQDEALRRLNDGSRPKKETDAQRGRRERAQELRDPQNFTRHIVQRGDNLTEIARIRRGLTVSLLAQVNGITNPDLLPVGTVLRVPSQRWLDIQAARQDKLDRFLFYGSRHGLPPLPRTLEEGSRHVDLSKLPSIEDQIAADLKTFVENGYTFTGDPYDRVPSSVSGQLQFGMRAERSKKEQLSAGGEDRRPSDQGGHLIATIFNGPAKWFNHFAQDANFNNGAFKKLELRWKRLGEAGHKIFVEITVFRKGISKRPVALNVKWSEDDQKFERDYQNEAGGQ